MIELFILLLTPFFILWSFWLRYFRKIISGGLDYVGNSYTENKIRILPSSSVKVKIKGKTVIVVSGVSSWVTIRVNGGPRQKVFKIRLLNTEGEVEIINENRVFQVNVVIRQAV
ncbi:MULTISPECIES: hypothetical protein [Acidianus]|uniref:Uncharacterized protein n=1 Tax=Candidatus Acidianus copahuensis TaxID=1160895 RepID=A0A031LIV4_9CREN|nr:MULTISPECIES: hypothetical protein [Acidianus]EZQ02072.1 hypothetical protein CM19_11435 [Candidatus Acidianus copahuensis]NON62311.1 hypothetical protein [Acidianus sp. RZ1]